MQEFVAEGRRKGGKNEILKLTSWDMNTYENNRVPKCDVIENEICEIMGFVKLF